jgi:hypothetical protein
MLQATRQGFLALRRSWSLAVLLLAVNVAAAMVLAAPLAGRLERELSHTEAGSTMMYGFDFPWWSRWSELQSGWTGSFAPDIFGVGLAFKNVDLLLRGQLPAGLLAAPRGEGSGATLDAVILALGAVYLLLQTFLAGGVLGALRAPQGSWTVRSLLHGSGFYFGRFLRLAALALLAAWATFQLHAPFARWADGQAQEAVSGATALWWTLGHNLVLLVAIGFLHVVSSYAKVIVVVEERSSAILAYLSSLSFCLANARKAFGHYLAMALLGGLLLLLWQALDGRWDATGYKTQLVTLLMAEGFLLARIGLRLALLGGQLALYRENA